MKASPAPSAPLAIDLRDLSLTFETADAPVVALSKVNLQIKSGEFVSLIGPSGCGKTTLLRVMADLARPTGGDIKVNGLSPQEARLARAYGYVFQADLAFRTLRAGLRVVEVPIEFVERVRGDSKMTRDVATESLRRITRWGLAERRRQLRERLSRRAAP